MPGLTLLLTARNGDAKVPFSAAQASMLHAPDYRAALAGCGDGLIVGHVAYPEYPLRLIEHAGTLVAVEGRIYNSDSVAIEASLRGLADVAFTSPTACRDAVHRWMLEHDGEYVVLIASLGSGEVLLFNDPLGRLPLYYSVTNSELVAARECKFVARLSGARFDRLGWAQALWLGYPLSGRTLFEGIQRLPCGAMLSARRTAGGIACSIKQLVQLQFDNKDTETPVVDHVRDLIDELAASCRRRGLYSGNSTNLVSLSGGQDSRAVAAALRRVDIPFSAVTFRTASGRGAREVPGAMAIASRLGMPWELFRLPDADMAQQRRLVILKDGQNYVAMAFILPFMDALVARWGRGAVYITGDGGDKLLPSLMPAASIPSPEALVRHVEERHSLVPSGTVEAVFGLASGTLRDDLGRVLEKYPERDLAQKAVHYTIYERGVQWLFEGEDRARFFMWQTSPFYSLPFVERAMRVPDRFKASGRLYRHIQLALAPDLASIPDANHGLSIRSPLYPLRTWTIGNYLRLSRQARSRIKGMLGRNRRVVVPEEMLALISDDSLMDAATVRSLLETGGRSTVFNWATLALLEREWPGRG